MKTRFAHTSFEPLEKRQLYSVQFGTPTPYLTAGNTIRDLAVGDFNHDGKQDVAVLTSANGLTSLEWFEGDGHGKLGSAHLIAATGSDVLAAGDFDGDGDTDLADGTDTGIQMFINNGSALVKDEFTPVAGGVIAIAGVYAHNTNHEDIAIANFPSGITLYSLDAVDAPKAYQTLNDSYYVTALSAGDLNGDHVQDLVAATEPSNGNHSPGTVDVFYGNPDVNGKPTGFFYFGPSYDGGSVPRQVVVTDLDGNSKADVLCVNQGDDYYKIPGGVWAMAGNGAGALGDPSKSMFGSYPWRVAVADFGSGKVDYVAAGLSDGLLYASGKGDGTFGLPSKQTASVDSPIGVWTTDLNGDGKRDLVAADNTGHVYTILNNGLTGSISGTVFVDANHNGIQDIGEAGKANWWVYVDANNNQLLDGGEVNALTDANGAYTLSGLPAGTYKVRERVYSYAGWSQTTPLNGFGLNVTLGTHEDVSNKNFGIAETDYLVGTVFNDANGNGTKDAGESGLEGRTVYLDANNNGILDAGEKTATSSASGIAIFFGLPPGTYKVREITPAGWSQTSPLNGNGQSATLSFGQGAVDASFGQKQTVANGSISGSVFNDANGNGTKDANEGYVAGRTVYIDLDNDKVLDPNEKSTTTNAAGYFALSGLASGTYKVRQVLPAGWSQTTPANGYGINVTLAANQSIGGKLFGAKQIAPPAGASISGTVFYDFNGNSVKDAGEAGLSGRTIWIDLDNDKILDAGEKSVVTDASGNFKFTGLAAGTYKVRQLLPAGWAQTTPVNGYGISVTVATNQAATGKLFGEAMTI